MLTPTALRELGAFAMRKEHLYLLRQLLNQHVRKKPRLLLRWITGERNELLVRSRLYTGDFQGALRKATAHLISKPNDVSTRVLAICCAIELRNFICAKYHMTFLNVCKIPFEMQKQIRCFSYMIVKADRELGPRVAIGQFDALYRSIGCRPVRFRHGADTKLFDLLSVTVGESPLPPSPSIEHASATDGPLVSVVMTTFNVGEFIETSLLSILTQSYKQLEVIVVDDCSTDCTPSVLREFARKDSRVHVVYKESNEGTYVCKNLGLTVARGIYVAFQDADDWSHPDRIAKSVAVLQQRARVCALTTEQVRMTSEGDLAITALGRCMYLSHISLVIRRRKVLSRAGYFDSVRAGADEEYRERLKVIFGKDAVLEAPWLLSFLRHRADSLTGGGSFRMIRGVAGPVRVKYRKAYKKWHAEIGRSHDGYVAFPLVNRAFGSPEVMLP